MIKKLTLLLLIFIYNINIQAQIKLKTVRHNNENMFLYPYSINTEPDKLIYAILQSGDTKNFETLLKIEAENFGEESISEIELLRNKKYIKKIIKKMEAFKLDSKSYAYLQKKPELLYKNAILINHDITPALDVLPDGKYIQYYNHYYEFDAQGKIQLNTNKVAGIFQLKNNTLEGEAIWFGVDGDTVKKGSFKQGIKDGKWYYKNVRYNEFIKEGFDKKNTYNNLINLNSAVKVIRSEYKNGSLNGSYEQYINDTLIYKGFYKDGVEVGEWYQYNFKLNDEYKLENYFLLKHYFINEEKNTSKKMFYRNQSNLNYYMNNYDGELKFPKNSKDIPQINFKSFFVYNYEKFNGIELPEEKDEYSYKYIAPPSKHKLIDSIGYYWKYKNFYEEFYDNGQIKFRYEFKDGELIKEDTIFFKTGKPSNILFYNDSLHAYQQNSYDENGTLYLVEVYDSTGLIKETPLDLVSDVRNFKINGYNILGSSYDEYFSYDSYDSLMNRVQEEPIYINRTWYNNPDTTEYYSELFNPKNKTVHKTVNNLAGNTYYEADYKFSEEFDNYSFSSTINFENILIKSVGNAFYIDREHLKDSLKQARIININSNYDLTVDRELFVDGKLFNGTFEFKTSKKDFKYSINKSKIIFEVPNSHEYESNLEMEFAKDYKAACSKYNKLTKFLESKTDIYFQIKDFFRFLDFTDEIIYSDYEYLEYSEQLSTPYKIVGKFVDGKPHGNWKIYGLNNKVLSDFNLKNGVLEGEVKTYNYAYPIDSEYMEFETKNINTPKKTTYYLAEKYTYKNGILQGNYFTYDWEGNIEGEEHYKDGYKDGLNVRKNKLATISQNYENGQLDGDSKAYLTIPNKDSILVFNLKFQNGLLQGESQAYHSNGKLAKRGFFLNGQAIDDYQAFDTLGNIYHYVKFKYSFPVEEKIWEENQLSVKYEFDWKDSIWFMPNALTDVPSLHGLLYDHGLFDEMEEPYMGRSSIIDKEEVKYKMTKYFPNDSIARIGQLEGNKKYGHWKFYNFKNQLLYEINYFDTILTVNDSIRFKSKGIIQQYDSLGKLNHKSYIIEKIEKYDCSHIDHYELRQFYTIEDYSTEKKRVNGSVRNYYDTGTLQSEGEMKDGLPSGIWKIYDPGGKLTEVGEYVQGKRNGRWLKGDLTKSKYLGDICLNPNLKDIDKKIEEMEKMLDINIRYFKLGKLLGEEYYNLNLNSKGSEIRED